MVSSFIKKTVFVGLSGGVDSAVSAYLLKKEGYTVIGVYMKNWSGDDFGIQADCPWKEDIKSAESVAKHLGIEFRSYNFEKEYREKVVEYFFVEYKAGRTPNPDVMCNKEIKFNLFLDKAISEGADLIATGHYVRKTECLRPRRTRLGREENGFTLMKGIDGKKDQSYFLNAITQEQLAKSLFPIGHLEKSEVRKIAEEAGLPNSKRPDSQGICFIGDIDVREFIKQELGEKSGDIIDIDSDKVVGRHNGAHFYTIGQREGIGIGGVPKPYYVVRTDIDENVVYVGMGSDHKALYSNKVVIDNLHLLSPDFKYDKKNLSASVRYRHKPESIQQISKLAYEFVEPQRAITAGQSLVLYDGDVCLGGGVVV